MPSKPRIDTRFLTPSTARRFDKKDRSEFERAYGRVLENLVDPSVLPYVPALYVIPYIVVQVIVVTR